MRQIQLTDDRLFPKHMFSVINDPVETKSDPGILIIIPSKNRNDLLFQCVNSIILQTSTTLTRVVVAIVDTGSTPETIDSIKQYIHENDSHIRLTLLPHGYYNFAKNNNQAFREMYSSEIDYVLFCNNDVKLLNDAVSRCLKVYETKKNVGTVGIRLHFGDGKIQHLGAFCKADQTGKLAPGHYGFGRITTGSVLKETKQVDCNTAAFVMMPAKMFDAIKFNETYQECYEDVELNLAAAIKFNVLNYIDCGAAAFHFESQTRNEDPQKQNKQNADLLKLGTFVNANRHHTYIKKYVLNM